MLRDEDSLERRIEKLRRINEALIERIDRADNARSSTYALFQTAAVLEKEVLARNRDLEQALADLGDINRELALAREAADEANRAKSRFLRAASHDLLQPLSAAKLFLSHLADEISDPRQADLVARIGTAFESTEELIQALLEISRLDSRRLEVASEPVSLGRLFQRLAVDFQGQADARGLDLRFVASSRTVLSDPVFLRRIAQNLVSNAIKYTDRGRVLVGARLTDGAVWLEVHDTGRGIAPGDQERIFNEFERLAPEGDVPGTGLGLSIVRRACLRLGHAVDLRSTPGRGTVFRIRLPCAMELPACPAILDGTGFGGPGFAGTAGDRTEDIAAASLAGRRVLVVENDAAMRDAYVLLLQRWGMQVTSADGTAAALTLVEEEGLRPDILVTDYRLDLGDTGFRAIAALRARLGADLPALLITAERAPFLATEAESARAMLLEKPLAKGDLCAGLAQLLGAGT